MPETISRLRKLGRSTTGRFWREGDALLVEDAQRKNEEAKMASVKMGLLSNAANSAANPWRCG